MHDNSHCDAGKAQNPQQKVTNNALQTMGRERDGGISKADSEARKAPAEPGFGCMNALSALQAAKHVAKRQKTTQAQDRHPGQLH